MSINLTSEAFVNALIEVTNENGYGYVYTDQHTGQPARAGMTCANWFVDDNGEDEPVYTPACIVGKAFVHMGFTIPEMMDRAAIGRYEGAYAAIPSLLGSPLAHNDDEYDVRILQQIADRVQELQDYGTPWGESLEEVIRKTVHTTLLHKLNIPEEEK